MSDIYNVAEGKSYSRSFPLKTKAKQYARILAKKLDQDITITEYDFTSLGKTKRVGFMIVVPSENRKRKNPTSVISSSGGDGWQAAHAFRQLADGRVQILTNPGGRIPKIKVNKNPDTTNAVLLKGWGYWDTTHYPRGGSFHRATKDTRVTVLEQVHIPKSGPEYKIEFIGNDGKRHTASVDLHAIKMDRY